jgi:hypothetical protein
LAQSAFRTGTDCLFSHNRPSIAIRLAASPNATALKWMLAHSLSSAGALSATLKMLLESAAECRASLPSDYRWAWAETKALSDGGSGE